MAKGKVTAFSRFRQLTFVGSIAAGLCVTVLLAGKSGRVSAEELYATAAGMRHVTGPVRAKAAEMLAVHPEAEPWLVLLFLSSQTPKAGDEEEQARQRGRHEFDLGIVAVALQHLPKDVSPSVLWALTYLLNEQGRGIWSEEAGLLVLKRKSSHSSPPIRQLARERLKDRLSVDHKWDRSEWQMAIMKKKTNKSAKVDAKPKAETLPAKSEAEGL